MPRRDLSLFHHHSASTCYTGETEFLPWDWSNDWHHAGMLISGFCATFATVLSVWQIYKHFQNYHHPSIQRYICRILLMVPIYAIESWLSFRFFKHAVYFDVLRDCYEAFVIYNFFILLLQYLGGFEKAKKLFITKVVKLPAPLCFIKVLSQGRGTFLMLCKNGAVQYVALRPLTTLVAVVTAAFDRYCPGSSSPKHAYFYTCLTNFLSVTVAMYVLVTLYLACHDELMPHRPVPKFLSIKFVIFFCFWQSVIVYLLTQLDIIKETQYASAEDVGTMINCFLVCIEMFLAALMHGKAFDWREHAAHDGAKTNVWVSLKHTISIRDLLVDLKLPVPKRKPRLMRLPDGTFMLTYASGAHAFDIGSDDEEDEDELHTKSLVDHERMRIDEKTAKQMVAAKQIRKTGSTLPVPDSEAAGAAPGGGGVPLPGGRREVRPAEAPGLERHGAPPAEVEEVDFSDIKLPPLAPLFRAQAQAMLASPQRAASAPKSPRGPAPHAASAPKSPGGGGAGRGLPVGLLSPPPAASHAVGAPSTPQRQAQAAPAPPPPLEEEEFGDFAAAAAAPEAPAPSTPKTPKGLAHTASFSAVPRSGSASSSVGRAGSGPGPGGAPAAEAAGTPPGSRAALGATPQRGSFGGVVQGADGDLGGEVSDGGESL